MRADGMDLTSIDLLAVGPAEQRYICLYIYIYIYIYINKLDRFVCTPAAPMSNRPRAAARSRLAQRQQRGGRVPAGRRVGARDCRRVGGTPASGRGPGGGRRRRLACGTSRDGGVLPLHQTGDRGHGVEEVPLARGGHRVRDLRGDPEGARGRRERVQLQVLREICSTM